MKGDQSWHRRHAVQVCCSLPEDPADALAILELARQLVTDFLAVEEPPKRSASVVSLVAAAPAAKAH